MSERGSPARRERARRAVTVSTSLQTRGGISSYVLALRGTPLWARWRMRHVATHRDGSAATKAAAFATALPRYGLELLVRRPDVVHVHMSSYGSFVRKAVVVWLAAALRVPVLVHVHGSEFATFHDRLPAPGRLLVRATLRRAGVVVALGTRWARRLEEIAPGARVVAVPNGVPVPDPRPPRPAGAPPQVVFLGEIGERKGAFVLLDAWTRIATDAEFVPGTRLTLAGDRGVERARAVVAAAGTGDSVTVHGWLAPAEAARLLADADVLVLPSRSEGQPMAVLEAMARGVCVVAGAVGGIPELIEDGRDGLLVPPDDVEALVAALRKVLDDAGLRAELGAAGRRRVLAEFDLDVVWRRFDALYEEIGRR